MNHEPNAKTRITRDPGLSYGLLGLPLAFVALPLYVHLPHAYASRYGMSLATLGGVLLLVGLLALYWPYFLTAQSQAGGIVPNLFNPSRFPQFFLMFGFDVESS